MSQKTLEHLGREEGAWQTMGLPTATQVRQSKQTITEQKWNATLFCSLRSSMLTYLKNLS
jgi:hypothetical protein